MKKSTLYTIIISLLLAVLLFSCEQPKNEVPVQQYSTPTIVGRITLPSGSTVNASDIYVKVVDESGNTAKVDKVKSDKSFVIQGLKEGTKYSILFTSEEPEFNNRSLSRDPDKSQGVGGWIHDVLPSIKEGNDVGSVKLKPLGTIRGKALIDKAEEHYDITVYIPGTSYIARTDADGTFSIYNVAEGTYKLRYTLDNHMPVMVEDVILTCPDDVENPEVIVNDIKLVSSFSTVEGIAKIGDANDSSVISIRLESEDKSIVYTSTSSKEGTYIINNVTPGTYRVIASSSGYVSQSTQYFKVVPATITSVEENIMLFGNIGTITGNVSLSDSNVKEGIAILIKDNNSNNSFSIMTDNNGLFKKVVKPGEYKIYANYPGYVSVSYDIIVAENNETEVVFTALLPDSGTITGLSYSPEEQVTVIAPDGTPIKTIQSGLDKSYRFEKIPSGTYSVKFSKSRFASYIVNEVVVVPAGTVIVNGESLKSSFGTISGTSASEGESVSILKEGVAIDAVTTSFERTYTFSGLEPGKYTIKFSKNGFSSYESAEVLVSSGSKLIINGKELVSIYGSIAGKSASEGETVYLVKDGMQIASMTTLENREYSFRDVLPGDYTVRFSKSGYSDYESGKLIVVAGESYVVDGKTLVSLYGSIYGTSNSEGESVILLMNGFAINTITTASDRTYIFEGIEPGKYSIRFSKNGYSDYESEKITVSAGESYVIDGKQLIGLYGAVAGNVILPDIDDYSGVVISLKNSSVMTISLSEISATDGSFRFDNITTPGTYLLTFSKEGYVKDQSKSINVVTGSVSSVDNVILKSTTATVRGKVQLEGASTYENVTVLLKNDKTQYTATTDQKGEYLINRVIPGTYSLLASKDGFVTGQVGEFVIEPSIDKQIDLLTLSVAIKSVTGSVELELTNDYAGVLVTATNLNDNKLIYSAITNSSGNFTLAGMKSGEYSVVLSCAGYNTITLPTINVNNTTVYKLDKQSLEISRGKIAGLVRLEGYSDYSDVKVTILGTDFTTYTKSDGSFEFNVPTANYPGGLRFEKEDMETAAYTDTIPVLVNSTYAIKSLINMNAINVPVISGAIKVGGTNDWSGVTVKLVEKPEFMVTTGSAGTWKFEHVPIGKYTIEYTRDNAKKVTSQLNAVASPSIEVPTLTIIPDSANIEGHITLDSVSDYSGVTVRVVTSEITNGLSTKTDSTGYFYIGNLLSTGKHTVYIEKAGWDTQEIELTNLEPLSLTDITTNNQIILKDTTKPSLTSISINSGANATGARNVNITVNGFDSGSGIALMQYSWTNDFSASSWINYASSFDITIPDENNGAKTLRLKVKDYAGNESIIVSDSIELVNQIKSIGGQLSVNELHWVKSNNPYVITDDVIIPEGRTLVIDPGVDILFAGNYSILIRGALSAKGTENEHIVLRSSKDYMEKEYNGEGFINYDGEWGGISAGTNQLEVNRDSYSFEFISGSQISYCDIQDIGNGIRGNIYVANSTITSNTYAIGNHENRFTGTLINSKISGSAFFGDNSISFGNEFKASDYRFIVPENAYYDSYNNYYYWYDEQGKTHQYYLNNNRYEYLNEQGNWQYIYFNNFWTNKRYILINNKIDGYKVDLETWYSDSKIQFSSFENCSFDYLSEVYPIVEYCTFKNNKNTIEFNNLYGIRFCNFINNTNQYLLKTDLKYTDRSTHDMRYNYWDTENTNKLNSINGSSNPNVDFFYDGIDNIDLSVINYSGYVSKPWAMAGYQGDNFCDVGAKFVRQYDNSEEAKVGSDIEIDLEMLTDDSIAKYRVAQSVDDLVNSNWITYYGSSSYSGNSVDYSKLDDGYLDLYLQVCTSDGAISPIKNIRVGYDLPTISNISITDGYTISKDNKINMTVNGKNAGYGFNLFAWIDDNEKEKKSWWIYTGKNEITNFIDPTMLVNGSHILKLQTIDSVGDTYEVNINFIVARPTPIVTNLSVDNRNIGPGNDLKISITATNTKHLKQMRVMMDEVVISQIDYPDNNASSISENISVESIYLKDGQHSIKVVMEDYTGNITYSKTDNVNISSNNSTAPTISNLDFENNKKFTENKIQSFTMKVSDDGGISLIDVTLDGNTNLYYFYDTKYQEAYKNIDVNVILRIPIYKNGSHSLKIKVSDFAGNTTEIERNFVVERSLPNASLNISLENESFYYNIYSNPNMSWIYDGGLYLDNVLLAYGFRNNGDSSDTHYLGNRINNSQIPSGNHILKAKFRMQSGEIVESEGYQISKAQSSSTFDYGEGKTWNADGTLIKDSYTYYLWSFDSSDPSKESVTGKSIGSINSITNGLGGNAATVNIDNNELKMQFPNSTWTVEFWAKNENTMSDSSIGLNLNNILNFNLYKRSASSGSYINSCFYYQTMMGDNGNAYNDVYYSRDDASSWHHYAFVSDGSSMQIFVDGLMRARTDGDKQSVKISNGIHIYMYQDAFIDELRISNRSRTVDELWTYVQHCKSKKLIPQ